MEKETICIECESYFEDCFNFCGKYPLPITKDYIKGGYNKQRYTMCFIINRNGDCKDFVQKQVVIKKKKKSFIDKLFRG